MRRTCLIVLFVCCAADARVANAIQFTSIHSFVGADGFFPASDLTFVGSTLYGTTRYGGSVNLGVIYALNTNSSNYSVIYAFKADSVGNDPQAGLTYDGSKLYGTTSGTVYAINPDGTGARPLHSYGGFAFGDQVLVNSTLYGTSYFGGPADVGTVYKVGTDGSGYQILHSFAAVGDGQGPPNGLINNGSKLFGVTFGGGVNNTGTVFEINTDGTGYQILHTFAGQDGAQPNGGLTLIGSTLIGTASAGASAGDGTLFAMNTDGTGFHVLHTFTGGLDGVAPSSYLTLVDGKLFGETLLGGAANDGTIYAINSDGSGYQIVYTFSGSDGQLPGNGMVLLGGTLYGTTYLGGNNGWGTVFALQVPEPSSLVLACCALGALLFAAWRSRLRRVGSLSPDFGGC